MHRILPLILVSVLSGCASGPEKVTLMSGEIGHMVNCETSFIEQCYLKAGMICEPKTFTIHKKQRDDDDMYITVSCGN